MSPLDQFAIKHPHWTELILGVSITIIATSVIGIAVAMFRAFGKSAALRIGGNWTREGLDTDPAYMRLHPNVNIVSRSNAPKKIVHSIWVRESSSIRKPGQIYGKIDVVDKYPLEKRTTGGDPLNFIGPSIKCQNLKVEVEKVMSCPIWVQTTDNKWYRAQSIGNPPSLAERLRTKLRG